MAWLVLQVTVGRDIYMKEEVLKYDVIRFC